MKNFKIIVIFVILVKSSVQEITTLKLQKNFDPQPEFFISPNPPLHIGFLKLQKDIENYMNGKSNGSLNDEHFYRKNSFLGHAKKENNGKISIPNYYEDGLSEEDDNKLIEYDKFWEKNTQKFLKKMTKANGKWTPIKWVDNSENQKNEEHFNDGQYEKDDSRNKQSYKSNQNNKRGYSKERIHSSHQLFKEYFQPQEEKDHFKHTPFLHQNDDNEHFIYPDLNLDSVELEYKNYDSKNEGSDYNKNTDYPLQNEDKDHSKYTDYPHQNDDSGHNKYTDYSYQNENSDHSKNIDNPGENENNDHFKYTDYSNQNEDVEQPSNMDYNDDFKNIDPSNLSHGSQVPDYINSAQDDLSYQHEGIGDSGYHKDVRPQEIPQKHSYSNPPVYQDYYLSKKLNHNQVEKTEYSYKSKDSYNSKKNSHVQQPQEIEYYYYSKDLNSPLKEADHSYNSKNIEHLYYPHYRDYSYNKEYDLNHPQKISYSEFPLDKEPSHYSQNGKQSYHHHLQNNDHINYLKKTNYMKKYKDSEVINYEKKEFLNNDENRKNLKLPQTFNFYKSTLDLAGNAEDNPINFGSYLYDETLDNVETVV